MDNQKIYWYWLVNLNGFSRKILHKLLRDYKTPEQIYYISDEELQNYIRTEKQYRQFIDSRDMKAIYESFSNLNKRNIKFLYYSGSDYPEKLYQIPDPPLGLYLKGRLPDILEKNWQKPDSMW